jgi:hypothetical protein
LEKGIQDLYKQVDGFEVA